MYPGSSMSIFSSIQAAWLTYIRRKESCGIMRDNTAYKAGAFAVVDTETNWDDEVMSIGVVAADPATMEGIDSRYYIIDPEYRVGGMFANELRPEEEGVIVTDRKQALQEIRQWLDTYQVRKLFAYNASFDRNHLPEYRDYEWYDIMRLAAYRQYNKAIPNCADCYKTGRMKHGYGVENILRMLSNNSRYKETHNAVFDAEDELQIMQLLGRALSEYEIAAVPCRKTGRQTNTNRKGTSLIHKRL